MTRAVNKPEPLSVNGRISITMPMSHRSIEIIDDYQTKVAAVGADMTAATFALFVGNDFSEYALLGNTAVIYTASLIIEFKWLSSDYFTRHT
jgi:hypothetical protein